jgi:3-oxoacyl-[acyl-carrier-protein] synthase-1
VEEETWFDVILQVMREIFVVSENIFSPLGLTTAENFQRLRENRSGIQLHEAGKIAPDPFYASLFNPAQVLIAEDSTQYSRFEMAVISSIEEGIKGSGIDPSDPRTILILSSTKGNISMVETETFNEELKARISLPYSAGIIARRFGVTNNPVIVSHACISGVLAIITGMRMLESGQYDHAIVTGGDLITRFILSGFQAFQAVSAHPCRPFDASRDGVSLGEAAATLVLSNDKKFNRGSRIAGGSLSNDANHISGPSRTGEELAFAMQSALRQAGLGASDIDIISAHGTATVYNDEMEAKAIHLAGLAEKPVNSLKGHYGHTLGAAGLLESIISLRSMQENYFIPTAGYQKAGTTKPVHVSANGLEGRFRYCMKTASGFGGCNAALVIHHE